ncbi:MAG: Hpt domain-containing protein [Lachnospiraceae bacterium]|nr:Hpt domain-containing protein [Lachnospiraceae bacterium]
MVYTGSASLYLKALELFVKSIDEKTALLEKCADEGDLRLYTITVHALKSTSLSIGMASFSEQAKALELAGNREDAEQLRHETPDFLRLCHEVKEGLEAVLSASVS